MGIYIICQHCPFDLMLVMDTDSIILFHIAYMEVISLVFDILTVFQQNLVYESTLWYNHNINVYPGNQYFGDLRQFFHWNLIYEVFRGYQTLWQKNVFKLPLFRIAPYMSIFRNLRFLNKFARIFSNESCLVKILHCGETQHGRSSANN